MSDINEMARSTAHVLASDFCAAGRPITEAALADAFTRGALWGMTRAAHALAIARTVATKGADPANKIDRVAGFEDGLRTGYDGAQRAVATTHQGMLDDSRARA